MTCLRRDVWLQFLLPSLSASLSFFPSPTSQLSQVRDKDIPHLEAVRGQREGEIRKLQTDLKKVSGGMKGPAGRSMSRTVFNAQCLLCMWPE